MKANRILFCSLMVVFALIEKVRAESGSCAPENDSTSTCEWSLSDDGTLTISGSGAMKNYTKTFVETDWSLGTNMPVYKTDAPWGTNVKSVVIHNGITSIGDSAFAGLKSLSNVSIPGSVSNIGNHSFINNSSLKDIELPSNLQSIGDSTFYNSGLMSIDIPDSVTTMGSGVFGYTPSLANVNFGDNSKLSSIGAGIFTESRALTSITLPSSLISIPNNAFGDSRVQEVILPDSITSIDYVAFDRTPNLKTLMLPPNVSSINSGAFQGPYGWSRLTEVFCAEDNDICNNFSYPMGVNVIIYKVIPNGFLELSDGRKIDNPWITKKMTDYGYEIYNSKGTLLGKYDSSGNTWREVKRIYTVSEATEALGKNNRNTFTIRYR